MKLILLKWATNIVNSKFHYLLLLHLPLVTQAHRTNQRNLNLVNNVKYRPIIGLILWLEPASSAVDRVFHPIEVDKGNQNKVFLRKKKLLEGEAHFHLMYD